MNLKSNINAFIYPGEQQGYVAECLEVAVVTQGTTLDEVVSNLKEAIALHLKSEGRAQFNLIAKLLIL